MQEWSRPLLLVRSSEPIYADAERKKGLWLVLTSKMADSAEHAIDDGADASSLETKEPSPTPSSPALPIAEESTDTAEAKDDRHAAPLPTQIEVVTATKRAPVLNKTDRPHSFLYIPIVPYKDLLSVKGRIPRGWDTLFQRRVVIAAMIVGYFLLGLVVMCSAEKWGFREGLYWAGVCVGCPGGGRSVLTSGSGKQGG